MMYSPTCKAIVRRTKEKVISGVGPSKLIKCAVALSATGIFCQGYWLQEFMCNRLHILLV